MGPDEAEFQRSPSSPKGDERRLTEAMQRISISVHARASTDRYLSPAWCLLPLLGPALAAALFLLLPYVAALERQGGAAGYAPYTLVSLLTFSALLLAGILAVLVNHHLVSRRNAHSAREAELRQAILDYQGAR